MYFSIYPRNCGKGVGLFLLPLKKLVLDFIMGGGRVLIIMLSSFFQSIFFLGVIISVLNIIYVLFYELFTRLYV